MFVAALVFYAAADMSWWLFAALLLAPDLAMAGYWKGPRMGAHVYNLFHITPWPLALVAGGYLWDVALAVSLGLIWLAHIGLDRALGYGLKEVSAFRDTHLGRIGRD